MLPKCTNFIPKRINTLRKRADGGSLIKAEVSDAEENLSTNLQILKLEGCLE
jgi:hypothetical protein